MVVYADKKKWIDREFKSLVGKRISRVRPMTPAECEDFGWDFQCERLAMVVIFDDGTCLVPSSDPEGNAAGFLFLEKIGITS